MRSLGGTGKAIALACAALCVAAAAEGSALAQRGRDLGAARRQDQMNRQAAEYERDHQNRDLDPAAAEAAERKRVQATAAQVKHDFEALQTGYNRLVLSLSAKRAADSDDALPAVVAEVNKCAARLKNNLALPRPKEGEAQKVQPAAAPAAAASADPLASLGRHLHSFLTNPLFESQAVLDVAQAARAARDLERIIELSDGLKRDGVKPAAAKKH